MFRPGFRVRGRDEARRLALPAFLELEHLDRVPAVVPEDVEQRAEGGDGRGERDRQINREGGVFLSEELAGFELAAARSDQPPGEEVQDADGERGAADLKEDREGADLLLVRG